MPLLVGFRFRVVRIMSSLASYKSMTIADPPESIICLSSITRVLKKTPLYLQVKASLILLATVFILRPDLRMETIVMLSFIMMVVSS